MVVDDAGYDFISSLPDAILHQILSYIPTKSAIKTSVLSKRWRYVWSEIPSLSIDIHKSIALTKSINKILSIYKAPKLTSFHLRTSLLNRTQSVNNWIQFAISHEAENLSLEFRNSLSSVKDYTFPDFFYTNPTVKRLSVNLRSAYMIPNCVVSWTSLKALSLTLCTLSDESLVKILSGCPLLESLELLDCNQYQCVDLSESPRLKRLEIDRSRDCYMEPTKVVAPYIRCLKLIHSRVSCSLMDVSSVVEANLNIYYSGFVSPPDFLRVNVLKMLEKLQNVEKLTLGSTFLQMLSIEAHRGVCFPILKVESLTLETIILQSVIPGITKLLQNSPGLRKLTVHTVKDSIIAESKIPYLRSHNLNQNESKDVIFPESIESISMMVGGYAESKLVASFMEVLLKNTTSLERMEVQLVGYLDASGFEELLAMAATLSQNYNVLILIKQSQQKNESLHRPQPGSTSTSHWINW